MSNAKADKIRLLNDRLRVTFAGGRIMTTATVAELENEKKARLLAAVRNFADFDNDNDPHNEHDMAFIDFDGDRWYFKIDYYNEKYEYGSEDPSDPVTTRRVITIGHHSDY